MDTKFGFNANVKVEVFGADGQLKDKREVHNTVTDYGVFLILDNSAGGTPNTFGYMGVGGASSMVGGKLQTPIPGGTNALTSLTRTNKVVTFIGDWAAGDATGTIREIATLPGSNPATALCIMYASFTGIVKGATDTLKITWTLTGAN